jgi:hypothetical protein
LKTNIDWSQFEPKRFETTKAIEKAREDYLSRWWRDWHLNEHCVEDLIYSNIEEALRFACKSLLCDMSNGFPTEGDCISHNGIPLPTFEDEEKEFTAEGIENIL